MLARYAPMSKRFVYILKNSEIRPRYYTGVTSDVARRHTEHNAGSCTHTVRHCVRTSPSAIALDNHLTSLRPHQYSLS